MVRTISKVSKHIQYSSALPFTACALNWCQNWICFTWMMACLGEVWKISGMTWKSEIICVNPDVKDSILLSLPGACEVDPSEATLLRSPIGNVSFISDTLADKTDQLRRRGGRLQHLSAHDAILLLKHSFAITKLLYCLRTAPCFRSPRLQEYDDLLKKIVSGI